METKGTEDMQIPVGAEVSCADGLCGKSTYVLINPITAKVTHLVVKENSLQHLEVVVPIGSVATSTADMIMLRCTRDELQHMDPFVQTQYIEEPMPAVAYDGAYSAGTYLVLPYAVPLGDTMARVPVSEMQIPPGELSLRRGTPVEAADGPVGHVDELLVNPDTGSITHLVMREGHLWGQKDVSIPIAAIRETHDDRVVLKLNKNEINALPTIPIHRPHIHIP